MDGFERLRENIQAIRIAHHLPGRIRLKLDAGPGGLPMPAVADLSRFHDLLGKFEGARSLQVNLMARSCTVEYDPRIIPFDAWADFLAGKQSAAARVLNDILRRKYRELVDDQVLTGKSSQLC